MLVHPCSPLLLFHILPEPAHIIIPEIELVGNLSGDNLVESIDDEVDGAVNLGAGLENHGVKLSNSASE